MVVVQWLSCVRLFVTPWPAACQALLSSTISQSLLKFISIKWVMLSNRLIFCHSLLLLPSVFSGIRGFASELALHSVGQSIGVLASASVLPVNIQCWFPLGVASLIFLLSKGLSKKSWRAQVKSINCSALSLLYGPTQHSYVTTGKTIALTA